MLHSIYHMAVKLLKIAFWREKSSFDVASDVGVNLCNVKRS